METNPPLWQGRQFLPLWISQFLSALNDNLFRFGLNAAVIFGVISIPQKEANEIVSLSAALFIAPYLVISGISGQLADKYPKSTLLRLNRGVEIFVFGLSSYALRFGNIPLLLVCLVLVGALAAFYGPVKLAITPELVREDQLIPANGAIEAGTYAAILLGTLVSTSLMSNRHQGAFWTVLLIMLVGVGAWIFSLLTPNTRSAAPDLKIDWNVPKQSWQLIKWGASDQLRTILLMGNGWFWFVGTAVLSQLTIFVKDDLHCVASLNTLFLALFAIGIGIGSAICNYLLKHQISLQFASISALGMGICATALGLIAYGHPQDSHSLLSLQQFLTAGWGWTMIVAILGLAASAGVFVIPMVTLMQTCVAKERRAELLSLSNIWFALFIIAGSLLCTAVLELHGHPKTIFVIVGVLSLLVSIGLFKLMPRLSVRGFFSGLLRILLRVEVSGLENLETVGDSAVIVANHMSLLDGALLAAFLPGDPVFAIDPIAASRWWARPLVSLVDIYELNPLQPMSVRHVIQAIETGRRCVIFPEGRLTETSGLMKIYLGPAVIAGRSNVLIVPVRIDGPQFSPFGRLRGKVKMTLFPKTTIQIMPAERAPETQQFVGAARREAMTRNLYDLMTKMYFQSQQQHATIWNALIEASKMYGDKSEILEDARRDPVTYRGLLTNVLALSVPLESKTAVNEHVGLMLPTGIGAVTAFFALQKIGRIPAMLNFSAGSKAVLSAIEAAAVKTVVTSREFIDKAALQTLADDIGKVTTVIYLEDVRDSISFTAKIKAVYRSRLGKILNSDLRITADSTAVILFTSGSEGTPKGVALSHRNLLSNVNQIKTVVAYNSTDVMFNALPVFHAFGLAGGVLVPLLQGAKVFLHPSPLQYRAIPELIYHSNATIVFGTDTFLNGWAKSANNYDFYNVRMVVSGAEKLRDSTRQLYAEKFGVPIYEGYGVSECSPVVALNTPMFHKIGTAGRLMPGLSYRLTHVDGIVIGSTLALKGPNVFQGYYRSAHPGILQSVDDGWYDTGDIVTIDEKGFVTILGRVKRFAKIAGEMISLTSVESFPQKLWPKAQHAAVSLPDPRKGEKVVLATTESGATIEEVARFMKSSGAIELGIPKEVYILSTLPTLGSGKTDYVELQRILGERNPEREYEPAPAN